MSTPQYMCGAGLHSIEFFMGEKCAGCGAQDTPAIIAPVEKPYSFMVQGKMTVGQDLRVSPTSTTIMTLRMPCPGCDATLSIERDEHGVRHTHIASESCPVLAAIRADRDLLDRILDSLVEDSPDRLTP